jgi:DNA-binding winged helix-turn-helix (wHTH) protein
MTWADEDRGLLEEPAMFVFRLSLPPVPPSPYPEPLARQPVDCPFRAFRFGPFLLQPERQLLTRLGAPVRIGGRALDLLTHLVERAGELVSKRELMSRAWPDTFVEEGNLKVNIAGLRRALGECPERPRFIATVIGRGYRFVAPVDVVKVPSDAGGADAAG